MVEVISNLLIRKTNKTKYFPMASFALRDALEVEKIFWTFWCRINFSIFVQNLRILIIYSAFIDFWRQFVYGKNMLVINLSGQHQKSPHQTSITFDLFPAGRRKFQTSLFYASTKSWNESKEAYVCTNVYKHWIDKFSLSRTSFCTVLLFFHRVRCNLCQVKK